MGKKSLISVGIVVVIVGGAIYALSNKSDNIIEPKSTNQATTTPTTLKPDNSTTVAGGKYIDYTDSVIAQTKGTKILFFHAPWCPQCNALDASIKNTGVPNGVTIIKVDYDSNQELRRKYGVTIQTSLVKVDDSGKKLKLYVAYDEPSIESVKTNLL